MIAWTILTENSLVPKASTAWVHLNNQSGGDVNVGTPLMANIKQELSAETGETLYVDLLDEALRIQLNNDTLIMSILTDTET